MIPTAAVPLPGVVDTLAVAVGYFGLVGVISGRPVAFLCDRLPVADLTLVGQYGMERWLDGEVVVDSRATDFVPAIAEVASRADRELPGVDVERKGEVAVTLHWRRGQALAAEAGRWAHTAADRYGLATYPTRMAVELRPPIPVDKGRAVAAAVEGMDAAFFAGDDHGDLERVRRLGPAPRGGSPRPHRAGWGPLGRRAGRVGRPHGPRGRRSRRIARVPQAAGRARLTSSSSQVAGGNDCAAARSCSARRWRSSGSMDNA